VSDVGSAGKGRK